MARKNAVAETKKDLPVPARERAPMGRGFEEADADSFAIPFLALLQKGTKLADPDDPTYVKGAKPGMFINTVSHELFESVDLIPCAYQRRFNRWGARDTGGGFKGSSMPSLVQKMEEQGTIAKDEDGRWYFTLPDGSINEKRCDVLTDTRLHYCLLLLPNGGAVNVLVSLSRTQLRKSKTWMALMAQHGGDMWDAVYTIGSVPEENDKGKWFGWTITMEREATDDEKAMAEAFYESVQAGAVKVKMEDSQEG